MTTGLSGTFAFNGTVLSLEPTTHGWRERTQLGIDGGGHPIYPAVRSYEMKWDLVTPSDLNQVLGFYNLVQNTGTMSVDLPEWGQTDYRFRTYSGTTLVEPVMGDFFNQHPGSITLLILNIRT